MATNITGRFPLRISHLPHWELYRFHLKYWIKCLVVITKGQRPVIFVASMRTFWLEVQRTGTFIGPKIFVSTQELQTRVIPNFKV